MSPAPQPATVALSSNAVLRRLAMRRAGQLSGEFSGTNASETSTENASPVIRVIQSSPSSPIITSKIDRTEVAPAELASFSSLPGPIEKSKSRKHRSKNSEPSLSKRNSDSFGSRKKGHHIHQSSTSSDGLVSSEVVEEGTSDEEKGSRSNLSRNGSSRSLSGTTHSRDNSDQSQSSHSRNSSTHSRTGSSKQQSISQKNHTRGRTGSSQDVPAPLPVDSDNPDSDSAPADTTTSSNLSSASSSSMNAFDVNYLDALPSKMRDDIIEQRSKEVENRLLSRRNQYRLRMQRRDKNLPVCIICDLPFYPGQRAVDQQGKVVHDYCFRCIHCLKSLEGTPYLFIDNNFWDVPHWTQVKNASEALQQHVLIAARDKNVKQRSMRKAEHETKMKELEDAWEAKEKVKVMDEVMAEEAQTVKQLLEELDNKRRADSGLGPDRSRMKKHLEKLLENVDTSQSPRVPRAISKNQSSQDESDSEGQNDQVSEVNSFPVASIPSSSRNSSIQSLPRNSEDMESTEEEKIKANRFALPLSKSNPPSSEQRSVTEAVPAFSPRSASLNRRAANRQISVQLIDDPEPFHVISPDNVFAHARALQRSQILLATREYKEKLREDRNNEKRLLRVVSAGELPTRRPTQSQTSDVPVHRSITSKPSGSPLKVRRVQKESSDTQFFSPISKLVVEMKRTKSFEHEKNSSQSRLVVALSDGLRVTTTISGRDTISIHGTQKRQQYTGYSLGSNKRASVVLRHESLIEDTINGEKAIVGASLDALINELTPRLLPDIKFMTYFLYTYPYLMKSTNLLKRLEKRWQYEAPADASLKLKEEYLRWRYTIRRRVVDFIEYWLTKTSYYFRQTKLSDAMHMFLEQTIRPFNEDWYDRLTNHFVGHHRIKSSLGNIASVPSSPILSLRQLSKSTSGSPNSTISKTGFRLTIDEEFDLEKIPPKKFARQLALHERSLLSNIVPDELLGARWKRQDKEKSAPHVSKMIEWFNHVSAWAMSIVLRIADVNKRAAILSILIKIAVECREINNFNGVMEFLGALDSLPIRRLALTWELVPKRLTRALDQLRELMDHENNFRVYRTTLSSIENNAPVIPYIGIIIQDIFNLNELPSMMTDRPLVNYRRLWLMGSIIDRLRRVYQVSQFDFTPEPVIQWHLENSLVANPESELLELSRQHEPGPAKSRRRVTMLEGSDTQIISRPPPQPEDNQTNTPPPTPAIVDFPNEPLPRNMLLARTLSGRNVL